MMNTHAVYEDRGTNRRSKIFFGTHMACLIWMQEHTVLIDNHHVKATPEKVPDENYKSSLYGYYTYNVEPL